MVSAATEAETVDRPATEAEIVALNAAIRVKMAARAAPQPVDRQRRRPLGLAPGLGVVEPEASARPRPTPSAAPARMDPPAAGGNEDELTALLNEIIEWVGGLQSDAQRKFDEIRAQFETKIAALQNENNALRLILENLRITQRGERGIDGDRGPPGRDGLQGPIGPVGQTGARGSRGQPGDRIVSWRLAPDEFLAFPIAETGKELPPLNLMPFFTEYDSATEADEVALATEQASAQRARLELETERVRQGLSAR
jgi:Collagen triple helix repeat (20 copies)